MHSFIGRVVVVGLLGLLGAAGCAASDEPTSGIPAGCKPGKQSYCRCSNNTSGSKTCQADKTFGECDCGGADSDDVGDPGLGAPAGEEETPPDPTPPDPTQPDPTQPDPNDPNASGTTPDDGKPAPKCAKLDDVGFKTTVVKLSDTPQAAAGGTIAKGKYVQTWIFHFDGASSASVQPFQSSQTIEFEEDFGRFSSEENGAAHNAGFRYEVTDSKLVITPECPAGPSRRLSFTATEDQLTVFDGAWVRIFELQDAASSTSSTPATTPEEP